MTAARRRQDDRTAPEMAGGAFGRVKTAVRGSSVAKRAPRKKRAAPIPKPVQTEAAFQRSVRTLLALLGYVVWVFPIMKRTMAGVPDLTFWHPHRPGRLWFWELKTAKGRVRPEQAIAIAHLATVPGVDARVVRPDDWDRLREML